MSLRAFLIGGLLLSTLTAIAQETPQRPNVIVIFADDLGYGDLGCFGHPTIDTPHLDQMARDGIRLTSFYAAASVCSPSRAALLTGRYSVRCGMPFNTSPNSDRHLPESEVTIADMMKANGYRTMAVGKWHLGHTKPEVFPTGRGFDGWYGLPYSNDMRKPWVLTEEPLQLYRNLEPIEHPVNQDTLTERYTEEAVRFIEEESDKPFFLYLAHSMPHLPVRTSEKFRGTSDAGLYGDVIETIDWGVGRIREALADLGIAENTLLLFTSDNGPWLDLPERMLQEGNEWWHTGSPGSLRGWKSTTYEGGVRVPFVAVWPGVIPAGQRSNAMASTLDFMPTIAAATGAKLPEGKTLDGYDLGPFLRGEAASPRAEFFYFRRTELQGVREGIWKYRFAAGENEAQLFHLGRDPRERYNMAKDHPDIVKRLKARVEQFKEAVKQE